MDGEGGVDGKDGREIKKRWMNTPGVVSAFTLLPLFGEEMFVCLFLKLL